MRSATRRRVALRGVVLLAFGLLTFAVAPRGGPASAQEILLVIHADPLLGFSIGVPQDWDRTVSPGGTIGFTGPPLPDSDFRPRCLVIPDTVPDGVDLAVFAEAGELLLRAALTDYTIVRRRPQTINGVPAVVRHYTWRTEGGARFYGVQAQMIRGRLAFTVRCITLNDRPILSAHLPLFERILESFRLTR